MVKKCMRHFVVQKMSISEDLGKFYRIPADLRNINYDLHERVSLDNELTNHMTHQIHKG